MSRNIKEIGKELMGKSLNSFHRKVGLTQLEENNKMQDGILNGILSQVDDAYIEKTEQSNVLHLDGSGDGVVVVDSIEGNTMVNLGNLKEKLNMVQTYYDDIYLCELNMIKPNVLYTLSYDFECDIDFVSEPCYLGYGSDKYFMFDQYPSYRFTPKKGFNKIVFSLTQEQIQTALQQNKPYLHSRLFIDSNKLTKTYSCKNVMLLEGDWTNKEIPPYFQGLQSSFEEQVEDDKYKIEILSNNKNLYNVEDVNIGSWMNSGGATVSKVNDNIVLNGTISDYFDFRTVQSNWNANLTKLINKLPTGTTLTMSNNLTSEKNTINYWSVRRDGVIKYFTNTLTIQKGDTEIGGFVRFQNGTVLNNTILKVQIEVNNKATSYTISKQNKIKLLLDEPLRNKDKLCIKDGKIVVERNSKQSLLDGNLNWAVNNSDNEGIYSISTTDLVGVPKGYIISDKLPTTTTTKNEGVMLGITTGKVMVCIDRNKLTNTTLNGMKQYLNENPMQVVFDIETYYEEVVNEYGEPILLEGYENGTLYIDSTIVPTTTVRYTPKMESFKTLNEVNNNNNMLTNDVNDNIIPYMMDVDMMILEKEMALMSHKNTRTIGAKDMTSMQKRTQDMLERLIKGKTLTEQECKTRVTTYLNAGKITDTQAEELNFLIDEIYA